MSIVLDIVLVVIAAVCIISGYRRGFFKTVMGLVSGIASLLAAYSFSPALSAWIYEKFMLNSLSGGLCTTFSSIAETGADAASKVYDLTKLLDSQQFLDVISRYGADRDKVESLIDGIGVGGEDAVRRVSDAVAAPVAQTVSDIIAFIAVFAVTLIALKIITHFIGLLFKLPVLHGLDKTLGLVFGCLCALFFVWVFAMVAAAAVTALSSAYPATFSENILENSFLLKFFAKYNVIGEISDALGF